MNYTFYESINQSIDVIEEEKEVIPHNNNNNNSH